MLKRPEDVDMTDAPSPYWDPRLRAGKKEHKRFLKSLMLKDFLVFTRHPKEFIGVFWL